jgi:hypothetical protein
MIARLIKAMLDKFTVLWRHRFRHRIIAYHFCIISSANCRNSVLPAGWLVNKLLLGRKIGGISNIAIM